MSADNAIARRQPFRVTAPIFSTVEAYLTIKEVALTRTSTLRRLIFSGPLLAVFLFPGGSAALPAQEQADCVGCHEKKTPGIVAQWRSSKHGELEIDCLYCHGAESSDLDAFEHQGATVAVIVSPKDCAECHQDEFDQQKGSHHAKAGQILGSLDNLLGELVGGQPAVNAGCRQCHGSEVRVDDSGRPTADTWPNTGMGRINPDGSRGSCSACHTRHEFSKAQARQPEGCGKCHLGPDHPQIEVWNESKHGVLYHANREKLNLDSDPWRAGQEYFSGPTCASCHMSAAGDQESTHDVGARISWTLRPPVSVKLNMLVFEDHSKQDITGDEPQLPEAGAMLDDGQGGQKKVTRVLTWKDRRSNMQQVCTMCHAGSFVAGAYDQFDQVVLLYNDKFARPAASIIDELHKAGRITAVDFDDPIEWTWWELWHHEGRRARHGASMQGPDYTWWHGMYEVAKHFYEKFIPQVIEVAGEEQAKLLLEKYVYSQPGHLWHRDGYSDEVREKIRQFYQERYKQ
ncbi:MAG: cytochrome C552 [Candidatus Glassbacteria bacterium]|nr:cytochrome C552 [Candidatus Glassbacteria bacterium]